MGMGTLTVPQGLGFVGVQYRDAPSLWKLKMRESQGYTAVPSRCLVPFIPILYLSLFLHFLLPFRTIDSRGFLSLMFSIAF